MSKLKLVVLTIIIAQSTLAAQANRPQHPVEPFPYSTETIFIENKSDTVKLGGTLTMPSTGTDFPAVVLISGSGPQDRNSEIFEHKPFLVIADHLTRQGIAVLRLDDRGVGESEGSHNKTNMSGFKRDAQSAFEYLRGRNEINPQQIGFIGHSMGGTIAPIIAAETEGVGFIVLLAGTGLRGDKVMLLQKAIIEKKMGMTEAGVALGQKTIGGAYEIILEEQQPSESLSIKLTQYFLKAYAGVMTESQAKSTASQLLIPWLMEFIKYDPAVNFPKVKCPVLAMNGSIDVQVPAKENLEAIKYGIIAGGNADVTTVEIGKLNHLFQEGVTGMVNEYGSLEETFSPFALRIMSDWILEKTQKK